MPSTQVKTRVSGGACLPSPGGAEEEETDRLLGPMDQLVELQAKEEMLSQIKTKVDDTQHHSLTYTHMPHMHGHAHTQTGIHKDL